LNILVINPSTQGHHYNYLINIINNKTYNFFVLTPEHLEINPVKQIILKDVNFFPRKIKDYILLMNRIKKISEQNNIDLIHFIYLDSYYRYFGLYLNVFKKSTVMTTLHTLRRSFFHDISLRLIHKKVGIMVVHTEKIYNDLKKMKMVKIELIHYPSFISESSFVPKTFENFAKINNIPVLLAIGSTRNDKGLDILLKALNLVNFEFKLIIAGNVDYFDRDYIDYLSENYVDKVISILRTLTVEEYNFLVSFADIIVIPYRKTFDGASGPLIDAVKMKKPVIASNHGSLGYIVNKYKLGLTFISENVDDLAIVLNSLNVNGFKWNDCAEKYRQKTNLENFTNDYNRLYKKNI